MNEAFLALSAELTGYSRIDLQGTGLVESHWETLVAEAKRAVADALLLAWERVKAAGNTSQAMRAEILSDPVLAPVARNLIKLWYLGQWDRETESVIGSPQAYVQGLVWDAIGAHPQGAKQQGFGTWSLPPVERS